MSARAGVAASANAAMTWRTRTVRHSYRRIRYTSTVNFAFHVRGRRSGLASRLARRRSSELVRQPQARLRASAAQTREPPVVEARGLAARVDEIALREVHDEVVADHVVDGPEGLQHELVHEIDGEADHRHDAPAAIEGRGAERGEALPVADLVAEGRAVGPAGRPGALGGRSVDASHT